MIRARTGLEPVEPTFIVEEVTDAAAKVRSQEQLARFRRNSDWLKAHWGDILPQARGKFVAIAGQEAFVADSSETAWALAKTAHPEDDGAFSQYVLPQPGPRVYANRWRLVVVR